MMLDTYLLKTSTCRSVCMSPSLCQYKEQMQHLQCNHNIWHDFQLLIHCTYYTGLHAVSYYMCSMHIQSSVLRDLLHIPSTLSNTTVYLAIVRSYIYCFSESVTSTSTSSAFISDFMAFTRLSNA